MCGSGRCRVFRYYSVANSLQHGSGGVASAGMFAIYRCWKESVKNTILFADIHLKPAGEGGEVYDSFLSFLRGIDPDKTERLVCLGDLFDFWYEYRHVMFSGYFSVLRAFADLSDAGVALHLVCGNHDFWAGASLEQHLGFHIHHEPTRLPFGNREALLLHGDGLNTRDYGYRFFKWVARNPLLIRGFRCVHPDHAMALALFMSRSSRGFTRVDALSKGPEAHSVRGYAHRLLKDGAAPIVICGHTHAPVIEQVAADHGNGLYVNPGDWPHHRSYVVFDGNDFRLCQFT